MAYSRVDIDDANEIFFKQPCGGVVQPRCWGGRHTGTSRGTYGGRSIYGNMFEAPDGTFHVIGVGDCREENGCLPE